MYRRFVLSIAALGFLALASAVTATENAPAPGVELVMVEQSGCYYCKLWKSEIGPIYPKTTEGAYAPLRQIDLRADLPDGLTFARKVVYTPTFILIKDGQEVGRIEGYPGEDFFWGLLEMMLKAKTDFVGTG